MNRKEVAFTLFHSFEYGVKLYFSTTVLSHDRLVKFIIAKKIWLQSDSCGISQRLVINWKFWSKKTLFDIDASFLSDCGISWRCDEMTNVCLVLWSSHDKNFKWTSLGVSPVTYWRLVWPQWWSWADVSQQGVDFSKKISKIRMIFWFDFHRCSHGPSKIRRHFRNKSCSILKLSKNVFYKKCGPKLIFFNENFF